MHLIFGGKFQSDVLRSVCCGKFPRHESVRSDVRRGRDEPVPRRDGNPSGISSQTFIEGYVKIISVITFYPAVKWLSAFLDDAITVTMCLS
jgi:hypothetical protein